MKVLSVNVGLPQKLNFQSKNIVTAIVKEPVKYRVKLRKLNFDGDKQADLRVHGGENKAVYSYAEEHYRYWRSELDNINLPFGMFGENLTTESVLEEEVNIGDEFIIGSAKIIATQPRMPCYKLGARFGTMDIIKKFMDSERTGIYFKVIKEGEIGAGDSIECTRRDENNVTVKDIVRLYTGSNNNMNLIKAVLGNKHLPESWRSHFKKQFLKLKACDGSGY